ncbi:hypothetical protein WJX84_002605 [Apatococcus fuscideae]|uniref:DNA polymerase eta n=1 Tax=Apatococcus fuscideae TaxID=2026836 RepID=A0AAW1T025_9CHLO
MEEAHLNRIVAHVDLDAFYVQVEVQRDPSLKGKPAGVVQYNPFGDLRTIKPEEPRIFNDSNGSLIAVGYEARASGVKRSMRGDEARKHCAELQLIQVPTSHGKADLTIYRNSGSKVVDILSRKSICERASIDECYIDITAEAQRRLTASSGQPAMPISPRQVHVCGQDSGAQGWWNRADQDWGPGERLLACGAAAVADLRAQVLAELGYTCSAGVAHNKILAKLASGMHKPMQQTVVPAAATASLLHDLPIPKLRQLGGKFGEEIMSKLNISTVGQLAQTPISKLEALFGDSDAAWLHTLAQGHDADEVKPRTLPNSLSCGKTFRGAGALNNFPDVHHWLGQLGLELEERIQTDRAANKRLPQLLTVSMWHTVAGKGTVDWRGNGSSASRSCQLRSPQAAPIADDALALVKKWAADYPGWHLTTLFLAASNFVAAPTGGSTLARFLKPRSAVSQADADEDASAGKVEAADAPAVPPPGQETSKLPPSRLLSISSAITPSHRKVPKRSVDQLGLDAPLVLDHSEDQLDPTVLAALPSAMQRFEAP